MSVTALIAGETGRFAVATWVFFRSIVEAILVHELSKEKKSPGSSPVKGVGVSKTEVLPENVPNIVEIKKAIPKECFQPSMDKAFYYILKDLTLVLLSLGAILVLQQVPFTVVRWIAVVLYWTFQGTMFWAIFVLGHDCGHDSFSHNHLLNDAVGTFLHSIILVPFYMWKLSHRHHHKHTGDMEKDEIFYPLRKSYMEGKGGMVRWFGFGFGWFFYLFQGYRDRPVNHYNPLHSMFVGHVLGCSLSLVVYGLWWYALYNIYLAFGFNALFTYYLVPILVFATYLVVTTFLHHTEVYVPWYVTEDWNFVKGQLSSVDRDYGIIHGLVHNIGTHQIHHLFPKIPHYNLEEATVHFRKTFPHLIRKCDEPILPSFLRMFHKYEKQSTIDDDVKLHYYK